MSDSLAPVMMLVGALLMRPCRLIRPHAELSEMRACLQEVYVAEPVTPEEQKVLLRLVK